ncbi:MAG: hypothetical protein JRJ87_18675 [Deltaproteobacteria bacterium]|nr:hypothetical protein [Deltaproteobacteria bacterium]
MYPSGRSVIYDYDPVGNRNFVTESWDGGGSETTNYTYSDFNQVLTTTNSVGTTAYGWDDNGNLTTKENPALEITNYDYNFENRLIGIDFHGGSTNAFGYDPQGIRTFKEDSEGRHDYLIDKASVLAEFDGTGVKKAWFNHNPQRIDEIVSQVQSSGKFFHLVDGLGSVTGLVNSGQVKVAAYTYDAYGALTDSQVQPGVQNPFLFTGREMDADSGLQYNRARYYLSGVGSWNREDPYNIRSNLGRIPEGKPLYYYGDFSYSKRPTITKDEFGMITITASTGISISVSFAGPTASTWTTADLSFDTEGGELRSWSGGGPGIGVGFSIDVAFMANNLYTNCKTVCGLLGPNLIVVLSLSQGGIPFIPKPFFGVSFIYWRSLANNTNCSGYGYGAIRGFGVSAPWPVVPALDVFLAATFRISGCGCKGATLCKSF